MRAATAPPQRPWRMAGRRRHRRRRPVAARGIGIATTIRPKRSKESSPEGIPEPRRSSAGAVVSPARGGRHLRRRSASRAGSAPIHWRHRGCRHSTVGPLRRRGRMRARTAPLTRRRGRQSSPPEQRRQLAQGGHLSIRHHVQLTLPASAVQPERSQAGLLRALDVAPQAVAHHDRPARESRRPPPGQRRTTRASGLPTPTSPDDRDGVEVMRQTLNAAIFSRWRPGVPLVRIASRKVPRSAASVSSTSGNTMWRARLSAGKIEASRSANGASRTPKSSRARDHASRR